LCARAEVLEARSLCGGLRSKAVSAVEMRFEWALIRELSRSFHGHAVAAQSKVGAGISVSPALFVAQPAPRRSLFILRAALLHNTLAHGE